MVALQSFLIYVLLGQWHAIVATQRGIGIALSCWQSYKASRLPKATIGLLKMFVYGLAKLLQSL